MLVTLRPGNVQQIVWAAARERFGGRGLHSWLIANRDEVNQVRVAPADNERQVPDMVSPDSNAISLIDALGSIQVSPNLDWFAYSPSAQVQIDIIPDCAYWAPSPAQVATQINLLGLMKDTTGQGIDISVAAQTAPGLTIAGDVFSTGVPLYSKASILLNHAAAGIAPGGTFTSASLPISQIGYEFSVNLTMATGTTPYASVTMTWTDSVSGKVTSIEKWWIGSAASPGNDYRGTGPTKGDTLVISITNQDAANTMTVSFVAAQNSRVYARDDWRQDFMRVLSGSTVTLPNNDPPGNVLAVISANINAGANLNRLLPLYSGMVTLDSTSPASAGSIQIAAVADQVIGTSVIWQRNLAASAIGNDQFALPRSLCEITIFNTGATNGTFTAALTVMEQPA